MLDAEVQLCGFTFGLVPGRNPEWAQPFQSRYPPGTWEIFPVAQVLAHDKAALLHHDLGKFVSDQRTLSWTLGLGFGMSEEITLRSLSQPARREWLRWLARIQRSIAARYTGTPVTAFEHEPGPAAGDDGLIRATYGPVRVVANLGPEPRPSADARAGALAGFGFLARAPGLVAGCLHTVAGHDFGRAGASFVTEELDGQVDAWFLAAAGNRAGAILPGTMNGRVELTLDGTAPQTLTVNESAIVFVLPATTGAVHAAPAVWHARLRTPGHTSK